jgi:hydrogenase-4 component B
MNTSALFSTSLPVLLIGAALALGLRSNRASVAVAIASQSIANALVIASMWPLVRGSRPLRLAWIWPHPFDRVNFDVDGLSAFFLLWSLPMTLLATIYAWGYLQPYFTRGRHAGPHFALLNVVAATFVLIYSAQNALVFLLGWEIAAVTAWLLVIWDYQDQRIRFAGFNYLVSTQLGLFLLVAAFMWLHARTDSMDFGAFSVFLSRSGSSRGALFMLLGGAFALKSAFFPVHSWLPRAHAAAPAHVSALMSGVIHKAGLFGFLRYTLLAGRPEEWMGFWVLGFGVLSAVFGVFYSATQRDLKRMLGYSSTENVGIAAIGFGVGYLGWAWDIPSLAVTGFAGGLLHILNHAVFKCLLFYAAGSVHRAVHGVDLERLGGLAKQLPQTAALFLIGALASCALPPLNGFVSELLVYAGLLSGLAPNAEANIVLVAAASALAIVGAAGALAITRAFGIGFLGKSREPQRHVGHEAPWSMLGPMWFHGGLVLVLGFAPELGSLLVEAALRPFPFRQAAPAPVLAAIGGGVWASRAVALALFGALAAAWLRRGLSRSGPTWGCGYSAVTARMQYTASSFSEQFARMFESFVPALRRERLPDQLFPSQPGHLSTHHPDAVERRVYEVLGRGEDLITQAAARIPEQPRFAFAAGLLTLIITISLLMSGVGQP